MHPSLIDYLCCPATAEPLALEATDTRPNGMVMTGRLHTRSGRVYPIVRGVPRFVDQQAYAGSFGFEWNRWPRTQFEFENIGRPMEGHTTRMWERITGAAPSDVRDQTIVEFGCGPGRFLDVVRTKGGRAVGIDLSNAVEAARKNFADDPGVLIVQADLLKPPFRAGAFDAGYTIGVLHHTPDPRSGLAALANVVRPGGWLACCVYPKGDFYDFPSVRRFRTIHRWLKPLFGYGPALGYSWLAAYLLAPMLQQAKTRGAWKLVQQIERHLLVCLRLKDARWRLLDVFDAITPQIATTHTSDELRHWLNDAGCERVETTPWCPTSQRAIRSAQAISQAA